jgi:hypothetical protein
MGRDYFTSWELGLEPPPFVDDDAKQEVVDRLQQSVEEFLLFATPKDLIKMIALQL